MKKTLICAVLILAMASSAFGAAFKIGGTGPLTGGAAIYGNAAKNGAEIAVEEITKRIMIEIIQIGAWISNHIPLKHLYELLKKKLLFSSQMKGVKRV